MESLQTNPSFTTIRFLGVIQQPDSNTTPLELAESDVVWSSGLSESTDPPNSPALSTTSNSPTSHRQDHPFLPATYGLSAALSDDNPPLIQRKPSISAASAARAIRPIPTPRSSSSFEELYGSGSGRYMQSAPVNIPVWPKWKESENLGLDKLEEGDDDDNELVEKMVLPPHEIVARSQTMAFSVFEGAGRTLKGRDLRRVRNAVFQKTGFLD